MERRGQATRRATARLAITAITVLVAISIVVGLVVVLIKAMTTGYRPKALYNTLLTTGMVVAGLLALRWIRTSVERGMVFYTLSCIGALAIMAVMDYRTYIVKLDRDFDFSTTLYAPHLGILLVALIAGLRPAFFTAVAAVGYLILLSQFLSDPWNAGTPIVIALVMPFTASVVDRLLDEVERESQRAHLAETSIDIMTHDLGNPLTVLSASLDMLEDESLLPHQREAFMETIRSSTHTLKGLLNEFGQIPHLDKAMPREMVDLHGIVHETVEFYARPMCDKHGQTLCADLHPVEVIGVPSRLGRLVRELLNNAIKYSSPNGRIEVTLHADEQAILQVSDNGCGIKSEELPHVFDVH